MGNFLNRFWWSSRRHAGEDILLQLLDGELSLVQASRVQRHLEHCWTCRVRREELEKAIGLFVIYRRQIIAPHMPPSPGYREIFLAKLDRMIAARKQLWWRHPELTFRSLVSIAMSPILASALVVVAAVFLLTFIWQRNLPPVPARTFLDQAHAWDRQSAIAARDGVIYQKVEIRTRTRKLERAIYRDLAGKRKSREAALGGNDLALKRQVESAGIDWEEPLSVSGFELWRSHQPIFFEKVTRPGDALLALTTSIPSGPVARETLTVRSKDFHLISRTIEMRDDERIEIAELSYAVLGWHEINDALFEPSVPMAPVVRPAPPIPTLHLPVLPTAEQLDLAELQARLAMNKLEADSREQIEFSRSQSAVQVKGIVESEQRKEELVAELKPLPFVSPAIFSVEELSSRQDEQQVISSVAAYNAVQQPSPLQQFFTEHGGNQDKVSQVSRQLLDAAASVKQQTGAIQELLRRFSTDQNLESIGRSILTELVNRHVASLSTALASEESLVSGNLPGRAPVRGVQSVAASDGAPEHLAASGERNMALCGELIAGSGSAPQRTAEAIASDILASKQDVEAILQTLSLSREPSPNLTIHQEQR